MSSLRPHTEGITPSRGHMPARVVRISYDEKASRMGWLERGGADGPAARGTAHAHRQQHASSCRRVQYKQRTAEDLDEAPQPAALQAHLLDVLEEQRCPYQACEPRIQQSR